MYLSGLIHRDRLFDIATRWLADRVEAEDGRVLSEIFVFERAVTAPVVRRFVADLCRIGGARELFLRRVANKDAVREAIVDAAVRPSGRVAELLDWYRQLPEEFFPRTPVHMSLVTDRSSRLVAMVRRKRIRRIADKVSRRVASELTGKIATVARSLAASRPRSSAVPVLVDENHLGIPKGAHGAAERLVADRIRSGALRLDPEGQRVDDVIGVKVLGSEQQMRRIEAALDDLEYTWAFDREVHDGSYVGTHFLVDLELPPEEAIIESMAGTDWSFAAGRGLDESKLQSSFADYVRRGRRTFRVELILTSFDDLAESEFGDCIHEQRILDQRGQAGELGRIPTNGAWIIEYMLRLAISSTVEVQELPIKLWGRYVRDMVARSIAELNSVQPAQWLIPEDQSGELMRL